MTIRNCLRFALDELWHPAATTALERALHPAGHGPNSSSLLRPQAAVVAVAILEEKLFLMFANRQSLRALPVCFFTGRGRRGKRQLAVACFLRKQPRCFLLYMYKSDRTAHTKHCTAGAAGFSTQKKPTDCASCTENALFDKTEKIKKKIRSFF